LPVRLSAGNPKERLLQIGLDFLAGRMKTARLRGPDFITVFLAL
jgi:hypothetical protein